MTPEEFRADRLKAMSNATNNSFVEPSIGGDSSLSMTAEEFDDSMKDLVNFLAYAAEPARITREKNGVFVILFFIVFTAVMNLLYREYAKELK